MKKLKILNIVILCASLLQANPEDGIRGSIITQDGKVLAKSSAEGYRIFPFKDSLSPTLGYVTSKEEGRRGVEQAVGTTLSLGYDVHLTINLDLQQKIESLLNQSKIKTEAEHIIAAVMESKTGIIVAMASSNRYDPGHIREQDIESIPSRFTEYPYEPGAVMMPIVLAIAIEKKLLTSDTVFSTYNGSMAWTDDRFLVDKQKYDVLSTAEMILRSSNIGISQVAWLVSAYEFYTGLEKFGFGKPSGIELHRDKEGYIKSVSTFENKMNRASTALGYGMLATFTQLLKAYSTFNNEGVPVTPRLIVSESDNDIKEQNISLKKLESTQGISKSTAQQIHMMLVDNVKRGTSTDAQYANLEIGGQTGTAYIYREGKYREEYHSSFYGFANDDEGNKYTIAVMLTRPKANKLIYASKSAVPLFREIVGLLVEKHYLK